MRRTLKLAATVTLALGMTAGMAGVAAASTSLPAITGFGPPGCPEPTTCTVTVYGTDLTGATAVDFGGVAEAIDSAESTSTQVEVTVAPHAVGVVDVTVTTPAGTSAPAEFAFAPKPTVSSMTPTSGPAGTKIRVEGTNFTAGESVAASVGYPASGEPRVVVGPPSSPAAAVSEVTNDCLIVTAPTLPRGASPGQPQSVSLLDDFTDTTVGSFAYSTARQTTPTPTCPSPKPALATHGVSPAAGPTAGGTSVTITGTNLANASAVNFGSAKATITSDTSTQIKATDPAHKAGPVLVTVATAAGTSNAETFDFVPPLPPIPSPVPSPTQVAATPAASGTEATISWQPAWIGGVPVTYRVFLSTSKVDVGAHPVTTPPSGHRVTVLGLTPSTRYYFEVVATDPSGGSVASQLAQFTTPPARHRPHPKPAASVAHWSWLLGPGNSVVPGKGSPNLGSPAASHLNLNEPTVGLVADPPDTGYWLFAADGGVFAYGTAKFYGSVPGVLHHGQHLMGPITDLVVDRAKTGYWLAGQDGGVFAFGSAKFYGSLPGKSIMATSPITRLVPDASGTGYWLVSATGQRYAFGSAAGSVAS